jgi:signal transduction histidine kinase
MDGEALRAILACIDDGVVGVDSAGTLLFASAAAERMLGPALADAITQGRDVFLEDGTTPIAQNDLPLARAMRGETTDAMPLVMRARSGEPLNVEMAGRPLPNGGGVVVFHDVGLRRRAEQLRQAQKMEAIGRLAGGIAHDFNNMLTVILTQSTLLIRRTTLDDRTRSPLAEIAQAANRAATLTRQLLAFSRQQVLQPRVIDLNVVVREMEQMLKRLISEDIDLQTRLQPSLGAVRADPGQMEQVILNMVVNARDAMPRGGHLEIATADVEVLSECSTATLQPGSYVLLTVSDTGCGMDAETQSRIFEPFFTTKERGHGTGLGLATAYGIVRQTGGDVRLSSAPGKGTAFRIYVPRVSEAVSSARASGRYMVGGSETILLVEDEPLVREAARTVLAGAGFTVLVARDGVEALNFCKDHRSAIHALVTDVVMPAMSGPELARLAAEARPAMRVLFMSGHTDDAILRHGAGDAIAFLNKPFSPDALVRKVREVLDK